MVKAEIEKILSSKPEKKAKVSKGPRLAKFLKPKKAKTLKVDTSDLGDPKGVAPRKATPEEAKILYGIAAQQGLSATKSSPAAPVGGTMLHDPSIPTASDRAARPSPSIFGGDTYGR